MITRPELEHFLTAQLGFKDWESILQENKEEFLVKFVHCAQKNLCYEVSLGYNAQLLKITKFNNNFQIALEHYLGIFVTGGAKDSDSGRLRRFSIEHAWWCLHSSEQHYQNSAGKIRI